MRSNKIITNSNSFYKYFWVLIISVLPLTALNQWNWGFLWSNTYLLVVCMHFILFDIPCVWINVVMCYDNPMQPRITALSTHATPPRQTARTAPPQLVMKYSIPSSTKATIACARKSFSETPVSMAPRVVCSLHYCILAITPVSSTQQHQCAGWGPVISCRAESRHPVQSRSIADQPDRPEQSCWRALFLVWLPQ